MFCDGAAEEWADIDHDGVAALALRKAQRPRGGDPLVLAAALGFELLPCVPGTAPSATRDELTFPACGDAHEHAAGVRLALAEGLLVRARAPYTPRDVALLAERLEAGKF